MIVREIEKSLAYAADFEYTKGKRASANEAFGIPAAGRKKLKAKLWFLAYSIM